MKRLYVLVLTLAVSLLGVVRASADEGMWLLPYLQKLNIADMKKKGLKLSAEDIYNANGSSLKDAVVIFGNGCTGEIVSPEGLLFTNYHCGYGGIQQLSSVEHDYLKNGFWAMSRSEELPVPGLTVRFIRKIIDVTEDVLSGVPSIASQQEYEKIVDERTKELRTRLEKEYKGKDISIQPFYAGNQYFAFVIDTYRDVRLVGTPPSSIGKFGGDTDNWMWPRHTCDFSVFRVYADKKGRPAEYSPENVPYAAETYLKVSLDGVEEDDFTMIMGFPGSTERYMTSYMIDNTLQIENPQRIFIRGERLDILKKDMAASDKVRIQYASKYAGVSNYWKNSIGMSLGLEKLNVKAKKEAQEKDFRAWAAANTLPEEGYMDVLDRMKSTAEEMRGSMATSQYLNEAFLSAIEILQPASVVFALSKMEKPDKQDMRERVEDFYKDYNVETDRKVAKRMLEIARENMTSLPSVYETEIDAKFGGDIAAYVDNLYDNSICADQAKVNDFIDGKLEVDIENDPAVALLKSCMVMYIGVQNELQQYRDEYSGCERKYLAGLMRMYPDKKWYPDANFTIRLTYGNVMPYDPKDGVTYKYYTTLKGVMEKEDPENPIEFTVPERLKELYEKRDFGKYADENGELRTAFIANMDITGGNSGSPVMNSRGELIGLAFDGNWEAMSGDIAFEPDLQRTISVDIRYVLFIIDKYAGAGHLLDEMTIVKRK